MAAEEQPQWLEEARAEQQRLEWVVQQQRLQEGAGRPVDIDITTPMPPLDAAVLESGRLAPRASVEGLATLPSLSSWEMDWGAPDS